MDPMGNTALSFQHLAAFHLLPASNTPQTALTDDNEEIDVDTMEELVHHIALKCGEEMLSCLA